MIGNLYIATDKDKAEALERERRRHVELERQARIFNPKIRKIGVDVTALKSQIYEKRAKEAEERKYDNAFDKQMLKDNQLATLLAVRENEERQRISNNLNEYRRTFQKQIDSREYDLNDPNTLKKQIPLRSTDDDIGLPSGQKFDGEDLHSEERLKIMREQRTSWLRQQIQEKHDKDAEQKVADRVYKQAIIARDKRALQLELIERDCKKQLESANAHFNKILAEERSNKITSDSQNETEDNLAEVYNTLTSDLMTENPCTSRSVFGPHRLITYMYKGMSPEEKSTIRQIQLNQIAEQKAKLETEKKIEREWENLSKNMSKFSILVDGENQKNRKIMAMKVKEENFMISKQQKEKKTYYDKIVYKNEPTDEYFNKYNTSSR